MATESQHLPAQLCSMSGFLRQHLAPSLVPLIHHCNQWWAQMMRVEFLERSSQLKLI
jgi:hypothetical protein